METEKLEVMKLINQSFGESGWSLSLSNSTLDFIDKDSHGLFSAGATAHVRITRTNGVYREDMGFGSSYSMKSKCEAISKARKGAVIDGLKGAFSSFGNDCIISSNLITPVKRDVPLLATSPQMSVAHASSSLQSEPKPPQDNNKNSTSSHVPVSHISKASPVQNLSSLSKPCLHDGKKSISPQATMAHTSSTSAVPKVCPVNKKLYDDIPLSAFAPTSVSLALPLPPVSAASTALTPEEELAKAERIRRSKMKQEEFRQKLLLQKAQAQNKTVEKSAQPQNGQLQQPTLKSEMNSRTSLHNHGNQQHLNEDQVNNGGLKSFLSLDVDDYPILSTQDMEAAVQSAGNNFVGSRRVCSVTPSPQTCQPKRVKL